MAKLQLSGLAYGGNYGMRDLCDTGACKQRWALQEIAPAGTLVCFLLCCFQEPPLSKNYSFLPAHLELRGWHDGATQDQLPFHVLLFVDRLSRQRGEEVRQEEDLPPKSESQVSPFHVRQGSASASRIWVAAGSCTWELAESVTQKLTLAVDADEEKASGKMERANRWGSV